MAHPLAPLLKRTHAQLVREVLIACNRLPGVFIFPVEVSVARRGKITRQLGMKGTSDLVGWALWRFNCTCPGDNLISRFYPKFVALEIKVGKDKLRPEQRAFLDKVLKAGGIAREIRSVEQAVDALK